jgi:hypothetical protein
VRATLRIARQSKPPYRRREPRTARQPRKREVPVRAVLSFILSSLLVLAGCSEPHTTTTPSSGAGADAPSVPWSDYATDVRPRIDAATTAKDCAALQKEFDVADANNEATRTRTGHSNADLMAYIDAALRAGGCY